MKTLKISFVFFLLFLCPALSAELTGPGHLSGAARAFAEEDWKKEFEDVCSKTQDAMSYSTEELGGLVERCDRLKTSIEKLEGTQRKVYLRRLQMCRDLFSFTLESKKKE